jgi:tRNA A22 N-methylase
LDQKFSLIQSCSGQNGPIYVKFAHIYAREDHKTVKKEGSISVDELYPLIEKVIEKDVKEWTNKDIDPIIATLAKVYSVVSGSKNQEKSNVAWSIFSDKFDLYLDANPLKELELDPFIVVCGFGGDMSAGIPDNWQNNVKQYNRAWVQSGCQSIQYGFCV